MYRSMEGSRHRKRFTPMSGELKAMVDFEPHDPAKDERHRVRPQKRAPATRREVILRGLGRLALVLTGIGGGVALIAWLVARHSDEPVSHVLPTAYYIAAAGIGVFAVLGGTSGGRAFRVSGGGGYDRAERTAAVNWSTFLACIAIFLFAFGVALDYLL
jgi:hypothetical protein